MGDVERGIYPDGENVRRLHGGHRQTVRVHRPLHVVPGSAALNSDHLAFGVDRSDRLERRPADAKTI